MLHRDDGRFVLQSRLPAQVLSYCKAMANLNHGSLQNWGDHLLYTFCDAKPWLNGLVEWKRPRGSGSSSDSAINWRPVNFVLSEATAGRVQHTLERLRLERGESSHVFSEAMFAYTAVVWYLTYVNPVNPPRM